MKKIAWGFIFLVLLGIGIKSISFGCTGALSQRAYLDRYFWRPFTNYVMETIKNWRKREPELRPFAGYAKPVATMDAFTEARIAYRKLAENAETADWESNEFLEMLPFDGVRQTIEKARLQSGLSSSQREEVKLLAAKTDLREGIIGDNARMLSAQQQLLSFLKNNPSLEFTSEARGWLACTHYHLGHYSEAAKIYVDEIKAADSNFKLPSLENSLQLVLNKAKPTLADHIDEYFDTPEHALLVVQMISHPMIAGRDPLLMRRNGLKILSAAEKHHHIFSRKEDSSELALAMMQVSLAMGEWEKILQYARKIPSPSKNRRSLDYYWMTGCANFLRHDFAAAEIPLQKIWKASNASLLRRGKAAMALMGVYLHLNRPLDALDAGLQWRQIRRRHDRIQNKVWELEQNSAKESQAKNIRERYLPDESDGYSNVFSELMPFAEFTFDLPVLLDRELTVEELQQYQDAHPGLDPIVPYSLAVRYARLEKYDTAAKLYAQAGAKARHKRMLKLQALYSAVQMPSQTKEEVLQHRFAYADFLSDNSCRIFFNDRLWDGFQTQSFLDDTDEMTPSVYYDPYFDTQHSGLTQQERDHILQQQRRYQDEQEEYWRAYHIYNEIHKEAGVTVLGRQAARKAIHCLDRISSRFGREKEIRAEIDRFIVWLKTHRPT
jgi:hypothetical protein